MADRHSVTLRAIVEHFTLDVITDAGLSLDEARVRTAELNGTGLEWSGRTAITTGPGLLVIGSDLGNLLWDLPEDEARRQLASYAAAGFVAGIFTWGQDVPEWAVAAADSLAMPLLRTPMTTRAFAPALATYLELELAPRTVLHAGLVDVHGEGVLILGRSGVGKSETALELIRRGHRMVADDTVEVRRLSDQDLIGRAPELVRHFMEIKGIGIVNLRRMYGIGAVKPSGDISLVVALEPWDPGHDSADVDASRAEESTIDVLGVQVPVLTIGVRPGRSTALLIELAATSHRKQRLQGAPRSGVESALDLYGRL